MKFRKFGDRKRVTIDTGPATEVQQSAKKETDINYIMAQYERTGVATHLAKNQGQYGNFIEVPDYHEAMNQIAAAQAMFDSLPATIRNKFKNDPAEFLAFVHDPDNEDEMIKMGIANPKSEKSPAGGLPPGEGGGDPVRGGAAGVSEPLTGDGGGAPSTAPEGA